MRSLAAWGEFDVRLAGRRATILARILSYDTHLAQRAGPSVDVALLYPRGNREAEQHAEQLLAGFAVIRGAKVGGLPVSVRAQAFQSGPLLEDFIARQGIDAIVLIGDLGATLGTIKEITQRRSVLSMGNEAFQVSQGIAVVLLEEETRLAIHVNLAQSKAEGALFSPEMLRLAKVVR